jgi:hypothetical protein
MAFANGVISDLKVYTDIVKKNKNGSHDILGEEIFTNTTGRGKIPLLDPLKDEGNFDYHMKRYPISTRHLNFNSGVNQAKLYATGRAGDRYHFDFIKFRDILYYDPGLISNYAPGPDTISITPEKSVKLLKLKTSLKSYINLNVYTDFLSLIKAERGNGLVQTEATSRLYLITNNLPRKNSWIFNYVEPFIKYSRFDAAYSSVVPDTSDDKKITVNRMLLNQRAFFNTGIKLNLYKFITKLYNEVDINLLGRLDWADVRGKQLSQKNSNDAIEYETDRVNMFTLGAEAKYKIVLYRNYGITAGFTTMYQQIWNNPPCENNDWRWFHSPEFELYYYPIADSESRIFLRFRTFLTNPTETEKKFVQMQIGYRGQLKFNPPSK